jgi:hypothetical protein
MCIEGFFLELLKITKWIRVLNMPRKVNIESIIHNAQDTTAIGIIASVSVYLEKIYRIRSKYKIISRFFFLQNNSI